MAKVWDTGLSAYENEKQNLIATRSSQNRFGSRFKKLFNAHKYLDGERPKYRFDEGFWAVFDKADTQDQIDKVTALIDAFGMFATSAAGDAYVLDDTLKSAFLLVQFDYMQDWYADDDIVLNGYRVAVTSKLESAPDDARRKTKFLDSGQIAAMLELLIDPLEDPANETFGAHLYAADGTVYGHYADPMLPADAKSDTLPALFCTDAAAENNPDGNPIFKPTLDDDFAAVKADFDAYLTQYIQMTQYYNETLVLSQTHLDSVMVIGLGQFLDFLHEEKADLLIYLDADPVSQKAKDDLDLIRLLRLEKTLHDQIAKPHRIKHIYFRFQKECTMPASGKWQDAKELSRVRKLHDPEEIFVLPAQFPAEGGKFWVYPKDAFLQRPNWQVSLVVQTFLDIQTKVKKKWYQKGVFKLLTAILAVVLIVITDNPVWLKALLITASVGGMYGLVGRDFQTLVAVVTMVYGVSAADFSSMSGGEMFSFAIKNINMTAGIVREYEARSVAARYAARQKELDGYQSAHMQDEAMRYIYTDGYSEYDRLYDVPYQY